MGFHSDFMGFHGGLVGFHSDSKGFNQQKIGMLVDTPSGKLIGRAVLGQLVFFCACLYQRALQVKERTHFEDISYVKEK